MRAGLDVRNRCVVLVPLSCSASSFADLLCSFWRPLVRTAHSSLLLLHPQSTHSSSVPWQPASLLPPSLPPAVLLRALPLRAARRRPEWPTGRAPEEDIARYISARALEESIRRRSEADVLGRRWNVRHCRVRRTRRRTASDDEWKRSRKMDMDRTWRWLLPLLLLLLRRLPDQQRLSRATSSTLRRQPLHL